MPNDAIASNTFQAAVSGFTLVDQTTVSAGAGWQGRLLVRSGAAPTLLAQFLARGQSASSVLGLIATAWGGNVDADVYLEQSVEAAIGSGALISGTTDNWLAAGVVISRGPGDDPTHFASCTVTLEIYDDATGLVTAVSAPQDWTQAALGQTVQLTAAEYQSDPTQWAVLQRRWRVHWAFTVTDSGSPAPAAFHGQPQFVFSADGTLPAYAGDPSTALVAGVIDITLASGTFNDLNPGNIQSVTRIRMNQGASCTVTGLIAGGDGQRLLIENVSTFDILLEHASVASEPGNLFYFPVEGAISAGAFGAIIAPDQVIEFLYSAATGSIPAGWYPIMPAIVDLDAALTVVAIDVTAVAVSNNVASVAAGVAHQHYIPTTDAPSGANVTIDAAPTVGTVGAVARATHGHELVTTDAPSGAVITIDAAPSAAATGAVARAAHGHRLNTYSSTPAADSGAGSAGTSGMAPARGDHVHPASSSGPSAITRQIFTTPGAITYAKPAGCKAIRFIAVGAGGGGGSGRRGAAAAIRGGGGNGGGGIAVERWIDADDLPASITGQVGLGGTGGAAVTVNTTNGNPGGNGTATFLGPSGSPVIQANPGAGGTGGNTTGAGLRGAQGIGTSGFPPLYDVDPNQGVNEGDTQGILYTGPGGYGGTVDASNNVFVGIAAALSIVGIWNGLTAGAYNGTGAAGGNGVNNPGIGGNGGGGGGNGVVAGGAGGAGGNGGIGSGGGGGGCALNGSNSGKGGNGGNGQLIAEEYY